MAKFIYDDDYIVGIKSYRWTSKKELSKEKVLTDYVKNHMSKHLGDEWEIFKFLKEYNIQHDDGEYFNLKSKINGNENTIEFIFKGI